MFGLKITNLQLTEAMLVSCANSKDPNKFSFDLLAKWLLNNIPIMQPKNSGFKLPKETAKEMRDRYFTSLDRVNGARTQLKAKSNPRRVLDYSCGDPFYNIRHENQQYPKPINFEGNFQKLEKFPKIRQEMYQDLIKYKQE
jgi:hypothetical protein